VRRGLERLAQRGIGRVQGLRLLGRPALRHRGVDGLVAHELCELGAQRLEVEVAQLAALALGLLAQLALALLGARELVRELLLLGRQLLLLELLRLLAELLLARGERLQVGADLLQALERFLQVLEAHAVGQDAVELLQRLDHALLRLERLHAHARGDVLLRGAHQLLERLVAELGPALVEVLQSLAQELGRVLASLGVEALRQQFHRRAQALQLAQEQRLVLGQRGLGARLALLGRRAARRTDEGAEGEQQAGDELHVSAPWRTCWCARSGSSGR
jgi:hypothetical protein